MFFPTRIGSGFPEIHLDRKRDQTGISKRIITTVSGLTRTKQFSHTMLRLSAKKFLRAEIKMFNRATSSHRTQDEGARPSSASSELKRVPATNTSNYDVGEKHPSGVPRFFKPKWLGGCRSKNSNHWVFIVALLVESSNTHHANTPFRPSPSKELVGTRTLDLNLHFLVVSIIRNNEQSSHDAIPNWSPNFGTHVSVVPQTVSVSDFYRSSGFCWKWPVTNFFGTKFPWILFGIPGVGCNPTSKALPFSFSAMVSISWGAMARSHSQRKEAESWNTVGVSSYQPSCGKWRGKGSSKKGPWVVELSNVLKKMLSAAPGIVDRYRWSW